MRKYIKCDNCAEKINLEYPDTCPICGKKIMPKMIRNFSNNIINSYSFLFECVACGKGFLSHYKKIEGRELYEGEYYNTLKCVGTYPKEPRKKFFDKKLEEMSPGFCKIYNEALFAENYNLCEISGIGYRKALEFLIKDYCIFRNPCDEDKIKNESLGQVIKEFVDSTKIKSLAKASTWIGNDETHYIKKINDKDINDLKKFIDATVAFITYDLISDEAEQLVNSQ